MAARTARQKAASRRNLAKARAKQRRRRANLVAGTYGAVTIAAAAGTAYSLHRGGGVVKRRDVVKAGGRYAKGFAKGYNTSRARQAAAKRNLSRVDIHRAVAYRVPQRALTGGSGHSRRRVRGY